MCYITIVMPPTALFSKNDILKEALVLVKGRGMDVLNARSLAGHLGISTTPILQAFGKMEDLKNAIYAELLNELEILIEKMPQERPWMALLSAFVVYSWKQPRAAIAIKEFFWGVGAQISWDRLLEAMRKDPRLEFWSQNRLEQAAFRVNAFTMGMADYAAQGFLYKPTEQGILDDLSQAVELLISGGKL